MGDRPPSPPPQDGANHLPESDTPHAPRHRRGDIREDRKLHRLKALDLGAGLRGALSKALDDSVSSSPSSPTTSSSSSSCSSIADQVYQSPRAKQAAAPQEPPVSKVPLRVTESSLLDKLELFLLLSGRSFFFFPVSGVTIDVVKSESVLQSHSGSGEDSSPLTGG